jgi:hypothetical protein
VAARRFALSFPNNSEPLSGKITGAQLPISIQTEKIFRHFFSFFKILQFGVF